MVFIPKIKSPTIVSNFRPLSLCNVIYQVVTEAIANRLKSVLGDVISHNQSAFISNRLITENVSVGYKCLHKLWSYKSYKNNLVTIKLDIVAAYDWVEWGFHNK